ncbi:DUF58 domain-containing protein [Dermatobacter hominis]|uniref:DUF58 domain-containing protein n=1 Tax=Dermatobacter hominis TaxID=2884263 RepID=UPI001D10D04C|nr:DUF58 domain-containing protein [Dermatobacter hominis]UDY35962.1 DUF58 domain-containing protein [Dermatobacter hominis]
MRLTRAGLVALVAVPVLALLAWMFGQPELAVAAAAVLAGASGSALLVARSRPELDLRRTVRPSRVALGEPCQVQLAVRNVGRNRTAVLGLRDDVGRFGEASLHLAPLPRGASRDATYSFPTHRRGLHPVGPLTVEVEDPFGLVRSSQQLTDTRTVIVLPRTWPLAPLPRAAGDEPEHGTRVLTSTSTVDEEFAAMRPYTVGDDIRRIHWRTTARVGEPVVRQYDQPWQRRTTVLLDVRRGSGADGSDTGAGTGAAFERAVSAAASVVRLATERHEIVRLVTTDGLDSGFVAAEGRGDELLDRLAAVQPSPRSSLAASLGHLGTRPSGRLVTCAGHLEHGELEGWSRGTRGFGLRVLVCTAAGGAPRLPGATVVAWDGDLPLTDVWAAAVGAAAPPTPRRPVGRLGGITVP